MVRQFWVYWYHVASVHRQLCLFVEEEKIRVCHGDAKIQGQDSMSEHKAPVCWTLCTRQTHNVEKRAEIWQLAMGRSIVFPAGKEREVCSHTQLVGIFFSSHPCPTCCRCRGVPGAMVSTREGGKPGI